MSNLDTLGVPLSNAAMETAPTYTAESSAAQAREEISSRTGEIADLCRRNHIRKFALFGSILRDDLGPDSDLDVLVEFEPDAVIGLLDMAGMQIELTEMFGGREVDLRTPEDLSRYFRDEVVSGAEVLYEE